MPALQYVIDSICANFTVDAMFNLIRSQLTQRPMTIGEIAREIRCTDRTLDPGSSRQLADAALEALEARGIVSIDGDVISLR